MPFRSVLVILLVLAALPATAAAAPSKPVELVVAPAAVWAGVSEPAYAVTLTNQTSTQQLGSADVTIPAALTVIGAPSQGTVTAGNVLQLRNLGLPPGGSITVTLGLRMPCVAGGYEWRLDAKQSNDFSGPPGNSMGPVSGVLTTTVTGSCRLRFSEQPAAAEKNAQIRADAFQPASPRLVAVEALDGRPAGAERLTWFDGTITLGLAPTTYFGRLVPAAPRSAATAGVATFADLAIDASGVYELRATTSASGFTAGESAGFQIIDAVEDCNAAGCRAQVGASTLTGSNLTGSGLALLSENLGPAPVCAGYTPPTDAWYEFHLTVQGDKTIEAFYTRAEVRRAGGLASLEVCFAAPQDFPAKGGTQPFDYDGPGPSTAGHVGLLPDCPPAGTPAGPCVRSRSGAGGGAAIVTFVVPAAWSDEDPRYR